MKICMLIGIRKESYAGEYAPEVLAARDEFSIDEDNASWALVVQRAKDAHADDMQAMEVFDVVVDDDAIRKRLLSNPILHGSLAPTPPSSGT